MIKPTCGVLYKEAISKYIGDEDSYRAFVDGFCSGQAEKVYLGACRAAMFRPSPERKNMLSAIVSEAAERYGLFVFYAGCEEIWLCRDKPTLNLLLHFHDTVACNSVVWHVLRGFLCGVPYDEQDWNFHERPGYGERCD